MPPSLRLVRPDEPFVRAPPPAIERSLPRWFWVVVACMALTVTTALIWLQTTADSRALRALPDDQRLALYGRTLENLRNTCDPAPSRSLRDFCREQAQLAARFRECDESAACRELVRRHLFQPRR